MRRYDGAMIVAVATENPSKVRAVELAFREAFPAKNLDVHQVVCDSVTPEQPFDDEIQRGAVRRARAAAQGPDADYGVGIEAGLLTLPGSDRRLSVQVCVIEDRDGVTSVGLGPGYQLPADILRAVAAGEPLRDAFERVLAQQDPERRGAIYYLTNGRIDRTDLTLQAVRMALVPRRAYLGGIPAS